MSNNNRVVLILILYHPHQPTSMSIAVQAESRQSKETNTSEGMVQCQKDVKQESGIENFESRLENQSAL